MIFFVEILSANKLPFNHKPTIYYSNFQKDTHVISLNFIIGLEVVWALLIIQNWIRMFTTEHDWSNHPVGYWIHEKPFVWPDAVIAVLMLISAWLLYSGDLVNGEKLSLVAAGMTLFLGIIDVVYEIQNDFHKKPLGSIGHVIETAMFIVVALVIIVFFF